MKTTVLKSAITRKRKSVLTKTASSGKPALGSHDTAKGSYLSRGDIAIGAGRMGTLNPVNSLGRAYYGDKAQVAHDYALHAKNERRKAALDRINGIA